MAHLDLCNSLLTTYLTLVLTPFKLFHLTARNDLCNSQLHPGRPLFGILQWLSIAQRCNLSSFLWSFMVSPFLASSPCPITTQELALQNPISLDYSESSVLLCLASSHIFHLCRTFLYPGALDRLCLICQVSTPILPLLWSLPSFLPRKTQVLLFLYFLCSLYNYLAVF